ncbi:GNAT family protein [Oryzihumus sp.]|uniref:GNAT family N-acetyltransferase n=1 Tax=Oryzihumus sp. TaxID=1968903 RepID=UPI002ED8824E
MTVAWPVTLSATTPAGHTVTLGPLRTRQRKEWEALRRDNADWLREWEATAPEPVTGRVGYRQMVRYFNREAVEGRMLPFAISVDGRLAGQMHLFGITWGSMRSGAAGYWVSRSVAGQGVAPISLALLTDHAFLVLGLHRVEVNIRPDNAASLRVVAKLGFRDEGLRTRYLHINGAWRDHRSFALTTEDLAGGRLLDRWLDAVDQPHRRHTDAGPRG